MLWYRDLNLKPDSMYRLMPEGLALLGGPCKSYRDLNLKPDSMYRLMPEGLALLDAPCKSFDHY